MSMMSSKPSSKPSRSDRVKAPRPVKVRCEDKVLDQAFFDTHMSVYENKDGFHTFKLKSMSSDEVPRGKKDDGNLWLQRLLVFKDTHYALQLLLVPGAMEEIKALADVDKPNLDKTKMARMSLFCFGEVSVPDWCREDGSGVVYYVHYSAAIEAGDWGTSNYKQRTACAHAVETTIKWLRQRAPPLF